MFNLSGKNAVITGATGGIGYSIASTLHKLGASICVSGTKETALANLVADLKDRVHSMVCNLNNLDEVEKLIPYAEECLGRVDILVCNAGITRDSLVMRMKNNDFSEVINVNLIANFVLNRAAVKHMIKNKSGRIINITSIIGVTGNAGQANYAASKAGLIAMSKSLAAEVASRGITVNCVAPGFITTPMTDVLSQEHKEKIMLKIPSGTFGKPEDIAYSVAFLASDEAAYINGQTLHVNGGMLMV